MDQDIRILETLCTLLQGYANLDHVDMKTAFQEFKFRMMNQVNLHKEAQHLQQFRKNFDAYAPVIRFVDGCERERSRERGQRERGQREREVKERERSRERPRERSRERGQERERERGQEREMPIGREKG
jgi:ABC1 atypical kinase-like domain